MYSFPNNQNVFSPVEVVPSTVPIPNFERRTATAGIDDEDIEEQMRNISKSSLSLFNNKLFHMSLSRLCHNDQSEQFILEDFTRYSSQGMYKTVAIVDTDTDEDKSSSKSDTE